MLKHKIDTLDGLEEALKPLYAKGDDGRYTLQVDEAPATNTIAKLKAELDMATKAIKDREQAEAKAKTEAERAQLEAKGDYEKLSAQMRQTQADLEKKLADLQAERDNERKESAAVAAIADERGSVTLLKQHVIGMLEDVQGKLLIKGHPEMTPRQFVAKLKSDPEYAPAFPALGSGAGSPPPGTGSGKKWSEMNLDERTALFKANPAQAKALQTGA